MQLESLSPNPNAWQGLASWKFRDPRALAGAATILLYIYVAATAANIAAVGMEHQYLSSAMAGRPSGLLAPETQDVVTQITRWSTFGLYWIAGIVVLKWMYRTNANAWRMANGQGMTVRPPWAVGWFAIPFANLWMPFKGLAQTWRASHNPGSPSSVGTPMLMRWWWGLWIVSGVVGNAAGRLGMTEDLSMMILSDQLEILSDALAIPTAVLLTRIMRRVSEAQLERRNVAEVFA